MLTLICFKCPEKVDKDWDKDCSSPISAKTESNQGIRTDSAAKMYRPAITTYLGKKNLNVAIFKDRE